jgi:hypothetical protein
MGIPHGIIAAGYPAADEPVQIASVATLVRRLDRIGNYGLVIVAALGVDRPRGPGVPPPGGRLGRRRVIRTFPLPTARRLES